MAIIDLLQSQETELKAIQANLVKFLDDTDHVSEQFQKARSEAVSFLSSVSFQLNDVNEAIQMVEDAEDPNSMSVTFAAMSILMSAPTAPVIMPATSLMYH